VPGYAGPLAGVLASLDWAAEHAPNIAWMVSLAGDCPFLPHDTRRGASNAVLACAGSGQRRHPVVGLWPVKLREDLRRALTQEGIRKVDEWVSRYPDSRTMAERILDLGGLKCPLPALYTRKALAGLAPGDVLLVECTDPLAGIDIPNLVRETGDALEDMRKEAKLTAFRIRKAQQRSRDG
jgi:molybdenum cofactor guanylyltransferase